MTTLNIPDVWGAETLGSADMNTYVRDNLLTLEEYTIGWRSAWIPASALRPDDAGGAGALEEVAKKVVRAYPTAVATNADMNICFPTDTTGRFKFDVIFYNETTAAGDTFFNIVFWKNDEGATEGASTTFDTTPLGIGAIETRQTATTAIGTVASYDDDTMFTMRVRRSGNNASDTYGAKSYLAGVRVYYELDGPGFAAVA